jgi:hypothetical protein
MRSLLGAGLVLAFAGAAPPSPAAVPQPAALFGGGQVQAAYDPHGFGVHFVTIRIDRTGGTLTFYGDWAQRCSGIPDAITATFVAEQVRIRSGTFSDRGDIRGQSPTASGPFRFSGRFTSATSAAGTGSVTTTWRPGNGRTYRCSTGLVRWQARVTPGLGSTEGAAKVRKGRTYYGNTSQNLPILIRVGPGGRRVVQAAVLWDTTCENAKSGLGLQTTMPPHPVEGGRAEHVARYSEQRGYAPGQVTRVVSSYHAIFGSATVAGTWAVIADVEAASGRRVDRCRSGRIRWKASL